MGDRTGFQTRSEILLPETQISVRLVFVGDISAVANKCPPVIDHELRSILRSADLIVGNCESPVVELPTYPFAARLGLRHAMTPTFLAETIEEMGVPAGRLVLSVANNHALDQGVAGFAATLAALQSLGICVVGTAGEPAKIIPVGDLLVAFAGFTIWRNESQEAFAERVSMEADLRPEQLRAKTVNEGAVDLLCALPHWGWEFRHDPRPDQRAVAKALIDAGAKLIVGGHPHIVQPMERREDTLIAWSLGDFLGTAMPRVPRPLRIGTLLTVDVSCDRQSRGAIARYSSRQFLRTRENDREHITLIS